MGRAVQDFQRQEQSGIVPRWLIRGLEETENENFVVGRADLGVPLLRFLRA